MGAPAAAPASRPTPDTPPGVNGSRGSPPGPWHVPADDPDPEQWRDLKIAPATPVAHADFVLPASADPLQLFLNGSGRRVMPKRLALMR